MPFRCFCRTGSISSIVAVAAKPEDSGVFLASLDSSDAPTRVIAVQPIRFNGMAYAPPGYLVMLNNDRLTAQRLDADGRTLHGDPVVLADDLDRRAERPRIHRVQHRRLDVSQGGAAGRASSCCGSTAKASRWARLAPSPTTATSTSLPRATARPST